MNTVIRTVQTNGIGPVEVSVTEYGPGSGRPFLLLHGGAGPQSVTGFAEGSPGWPRSTRGCSTSST